MGVSATAAYRHFHDKEALLQELAIAGFGELRSALRSGPAKAAVPLERVVERYLQFIRSNGELAQLMFMPRPRGRGSRPALDAAIGECLAEFVVAASEDAPGGEPEAAIRRAAHAWSAAHGVAVLSQVNAFGALDPWMLPGTAELALTKKLPRG